MTEYPLYCISHRLENSPPPTPTNGVKPNLLFENKRVSTPSTFRF